MTAENGEGTLKLIIIVDGGQRAEKLKETNSNNRATVDYNFSFFMQTFNYN